LIRCWDGIRLRTSLEVGIVTEIFSADDMGSPGIS